MKCPSDEKHKVMEVEVSNPQNDSRYGKRFTKYRCRNCGIEIKKEW